MNTQATSQRLVQKLWRFCDVLRDDGLSYPDYVEQLTYLLFLKMAEEQGTLWLVVPAALKWSTLVSRRGRELHAQYGKILARLSLSTGMLGLIFKNAQNKIKDPAKLQKLVIDLINTESWSGMDIDIKGAAYEGLLDKTAQDMKSGAGQYFTPRPLVDAIVEVMQPQFGERICDPAVGTAGFLLSAHRFIIRHASNLTASQKMFLRLQAYRGVELVESVARLGAMNLLLHGIGPSGDDYGVLPIVVEDSLVHPPSETFDVVLTNPPFGKKSAISLQLESGDENNPRVVRPDFLVESNNKQLNFVQHVISVLKPGARAAVVVPDNVLFEAGAAERVRKYLLSECNLHTLLRLPTGIFYAQGVKANVIFFEKGCSNSREDLWIYDLRTHMKLSLRANPLKSDDLSDFVHCYSALDRKRRKATPGNSSRWRKFNRKDILQHEGSRLDIHWNETPSASKADPNDLAGEIIEDLHTALCEMQKVTKLLGR